MKVLVTGATGYIGGRLVHRLLDRGFAVRCMSRDPDLLILDPWRDQVEVVAADALDPASLDAALDGCDAAYYLIHAMKGSPTSFADQDREAAENFRDAADRCGIKRIVYMGALGSDDEELSEHLTSRHEVGRVLAAGATPVTEFRAAVIIGSGSMSFEMIRHLTEVLPIIMKPKWVGTRCQPIAVRNVLEILVAALDESSSEDHVYDVGGPDVLTYEELMQMYAKVAGLRRRPVIALPIFSARLSPLMVGLATPLPVGVARPLIESLQYDVVVTRPSPPGYAPEGLLSYRESLRRALVRISESDVETRWSDAVTFPAAPLPGDPAWSGATMLVDQRIVVSSATADDMFWAVTRIGGDVGYYTMNWTWIIRGWFDRLIGGVGLRRGRRDPNELRPGEALDFFRVAEIDREHRRLVLRAEMKVPGTAWLGWSVEPAGSGVRLVQTAQFAPKGLPGRLYWWLMLPFHAPIFQRMADRIAGKAEQYGRNRSDRPGAT